MKISQHPRMRDIAIGDEVYSSKHRLFARVEEVFPAAVCVKVGVLSLSRYLELFVSPQLWRADDIENLSVCRSCGGRTGLISCDRSVIGCGVSVSVLVQLWSAAL